MLGDLAEKTLLSNLVAKGHAAKLEEQFFRRWQTFTKKQMKDRLRFITVLAQLVPLDLEETKDAVEQMFKRLQYAFSDVRGIEVIGAAEIEIVNIEKMKTMSSVADEARKLDVILNMIPAEEKSLYRTGITSYALVHFHGVIDIGNDGHEKIAKINKACKRYWSEKYAM